MNSEWFVWTIAVNRYKKIKSFLDEIVGIDALLYPTAEKEYNTKDGIKRKAVPIYSNYLFIKYKDSDKIRASLEECRWLYGCLGKCSLEEIKKVRKADRSKYEELLPVDKLYIGMRIKLIGTPFKSMIATLVGIDGKKLVVSIDIFGAARTIKCSIDDIDIGRGCIDG